METNTGCKFNFKVVVLGEAHCKTSLVFRYAENKFNEKNFSTLQASFLNKKLNIAGKKVNLTIWDTAGQDRFHALGPIYYRDSNGAILVYDITDKHSFKKLENWVRELKEMLGEDVCLSIVGDKTDLEKDQAVPIEEAESYATSVKAKHFLTLAKQNQGIDEVFLDLTHRMIEVKEMIDQVANDLSNANNHQRNVVIVDDELGQPKTGFCGGG